jgi:ribose transport system substrate-binding protein
LAKSISLRALKIKFVGIDALPHEACMQHGILDVTLQYPTGGSEASDVAVKILKGEQVPKEITLGSHVFDRSNVANGGEALP